MNAWGLYLISDEPMLADGSFLALLDHALQAGLRVVQMRSKSLPAESLLEIGARIRRLTRDYDATFIVNDKPELARALQADGVHLGQGDITPEEARKVLGEKILIGLSTHNRDQILEAQARPVDYIGVGPVFATRTKADADPVAGLELLKWGARNCTLPAVAIGGITLENLDLVLQTGARNIAVIAAISRAADPAAMAKEFIRKIKDYKKEE